MNVWGKGPDDPRIRDLFQEALRDLDLIRADLVDFDTSRPQLQERLKATRDSLQEILDELDEVFDVVMQVASEIQIIALVDLDPRRN